MKRSVSLWLILLFLIACIFPASAYTGSFDDESVVVCNSSGVYLIRFSGRNLHIERPVPDAYSEDLTLSYPIAHTAVFGDTVAAVCNDYENDLTIVYTLEIGTGIPDSFTVSDYTYGYHRGFYTDARGLLIQDDERPSVVHRYSYGAAHPDSYNFQGSLVSFVCGYSGELYILCDGRLFRYTGSGYTPLNGAGIDAPAEFIADDTLIDGSGRIYRISGESVDPVIRVDADPINPAAAFLNGAYYAVSGSTIYRYDPAAQSRTDSFDAHRPIRALYAGTNLLYAVCDTASSSVVGISPTDFTPCRDTEAPPASFPFSSDAYRIDAKNYRIERIPSPTTFAQLKSGVRHDDFAAQLYRSGKNVKSGNVGTGMTVVFS